MNRIVLALAIATQLLFAPSAHILAADSYKIEGSHTSIIFGVSHLGFSYTYGMFKNSQGSYSLDTGNPAASSFELAIDVNSIDTNDAKRDEHLKNADFFNVKQFPAITFKSTSVSAEKDSSDNTIYQVTGDLTMHGTTKSITLPLQLLKEGPGMGGKNRTGFLCETRLKRSDFGMTNMVPAIGDEVAITISFEGVQQ